jgi:hypothetical protein
MNIFTPKKPLFAYRICRVAVKNCQPRSDFHVIMNLRGLF